MLAHGFRQRAVPHLSLEYRLELHIAARDRVAHDDQADLARDVPGAVAAQRADVLGREERAHRGVDVLVRPLHVMSFLLQKRGQRRHGRSTNSDEMNRHSTPASSIITRGLPFATTRARTPNGRVTRGPRVCPDGKPWTTGPAKSFSRLASTDFAAIAPPGSSQSTKSPSTIAEARPSTPESR